MRVLGCARRTRQVDANGLQSVQPTTETMCRCYHTNVVPTQDSDGDRHTRTQFMVWNAFAKQTGFRYSIAMGSLIGYRRTGTPVSLLARPAHK